MRMNPGEGWPNYGLKHSLISFLVFFFFQKKFANSSFGALERTHLEPNLEFSNTEQTPQQIEIHSPFLFQCALYSKQNRRQQLKSYNPLANYKL